MSQSLQAFPAQTFYNWSIQESVLLQQSLPHPEEHALHVHLQSNPALGMASMLYRPASMLEMRAALLATSQAQAGAIGPRL